MIRNTLYTLLVTLIFPAASFSQDHEATVDSLMDKYAGENSPSIGVLVKQNDQVVFSKAYGYANLEKKKNADLNTNYNLGTLSEQFVVMTALMLQEKGKLDFNTTLQEVWEDIPDYCANITIQNLVLQNSGLPAISLQKSFRIMQDKKAVFDYLQETNKLSYQPGKKSSWNPLNVALLSLIIETSTSEDLAKFVEKNIFKSLEMNGSDVYTGGWFEKIDEKALSYRRLADNQYEVVPFKPDDHIPGTSGIYSSLEDMSKWMKAWDSDVLLSKKKVNKLNRLQFVRGQSEFYGYGWKQGFNKGKKYFYASGISEGNTHIILRFPPENMEIIILSNQYSLFGLREKAFQLLNLFSGKSYKVK